MQPGGEDLWPRIVEGDCGRRSMEEGMWEGNKSGTLTV